MKSWSFVSKEQLSAEVVSVFINPSEAQKTNIPEWVLAKLSVKKNFYYTENELGAICVVQTASNAAKLFEELRKCGNRLSKLINDKNEVSLSVCGEHCEYFIEGLLLSLYSFGKYMAKPFDLSVKISADDLSPQKSDELKAIIESVFVCRDLVNEPPNKLNATSYAEIIQQLGGESGVDVKVLEEVQLEALKMGGILAVNQGSEEPATFSIMEWKPDNAINQNPIVFVGKGVTYDTGGLSLKPTPNSMDFMKADMAGSAAVVGATLAIAKNKLPIHIITLVPSTDNRIGEKAFSPGDIITMFSGDKVEILNTDAEGRLLLADALSYAKKYNPQLVIDVATLTGAAARAIGKEGIVFMGNANENTKSQLKQSGESTYERLVEFPLWDEYDEQLKSNVADFTNLGGAEGGAITAGKFLQRFVDYEWLHLDIAGPSFLKIPDNYKGAGGTGVGVRLLYNFAKSLTLQDGE